MNLYVPHTHKSKPSQSGSTRTHPLPHSSQVTVGHVCKLAAMLAHLSHSGDGVVLVDQGMEERVRYTRTCERNGLATKCHFFKGAEGSTSSCFALLLMLERKASYPVDLVDEGRNSEGNSHFKIWNNTHAWPQL